MLLKRYYRPNHSGVNPLWSVRQDLDQLFGASPLPGLFGDAQNNWSPSLDVVEEKNRFLVNLELPGLKAENVKITFEDGVLNISGERKEEKVANENKVHLNERYYGKFERGVRFPSPVQTDKVSAKFTDGVLEVALPKTEETKPRQIEISAK
jgi:HSP20 family protein